MAQQMVAEVAEVAKKVATLTQLIHHATSTTPPVKITNFGLTKKFQISSLAMQPIYTLVSSTAATVTTATQ